MKLNIISWNIRHLRMEKVEKYAESLLDWAEAGHVMFFYENKESNPLDREFVDAIGKPLKKSKASGSMRLSWSGLKVKDDSGENVWIVYSDRCTTGPNSSMGQGKTFYVSVSHQPSYSGALKSAAIKALKSSSNETIMADIQQGRLGNFRIPVVVNIDITKADKSTKQIRVAAWHAPGPAKNMSALLNAEFQAVLHGNIDLFIGDFNMTGMAPSGLVPLATPLTLQRTGLTTTFTADKDVARYEGFDLVYMDQARLAPGITATGPQIANAEISVLEIPVGLTFAEAFELTDHKPVLVTIKEL